MSFCRICLDEDKIKNLIAPCRCNGTSKYVHYDCIEKWRENNINPDARKKCMECNSLYILVDSYKKETYIIDTNKYFFTKGCLRQFIFIFISMSFIIPIDVVENYKTLHLLDDIYYTNITQFVLKNSVAYAFYYYILATSFVYVNLYLLFIALFIYNIKRKVKYLLYMFPVYLLFLFLSCGYIYLYLATVYNINYYFIIGVVTPFFYYLELTWFIKYFHNVTIKRLNTKYNKIKYLEYPRISIQDISNNVFDISHSNNANNNNTINNINNNTISFRNGNQQIIRRLSSGHSGNVSSSSIVSNNSLFDVTSIEFEEDPLMEHSVYGETIDEEQPLSIVNRHYIENPHIERIELLPIEDNYTNFLDELERRFRNSSEV